MACLVVVLPLLLGLGITSYYMDGQVIVSIEKQQLSKLEAATNNLAESLHKKVSLERQKTLAIAGSPTSRPRSPDTPSGRPPGRVADNLSDALVLTRLEARLDSVRRKVRPRATRQRRSRSAFGAHIEAQRRRTPGGRRSGRGAATPGEPAVVARDRPMLDTITVPNTPRPGQPGGGPLRAGGRVQGGQTVRNN
jgi:hypothetical protein